jgi:hypothetical protein
VDRALRFGRKSRRFESVRVYQILEFYYYIVKKKPLVITVVLILLFAAATSVYLEKSLIVIESLQIFAQLMFTVANQISIETILKKTKSLDQATIIDSKKFTPNFVHNAVPDIDYKMTS